MITDVNRPLHSEPLNERYGDFSTKNCVRLAVLKLAQEFPISTFEAMYGGGDERLKQVFLVARQFGNVGIDLHRSASMRFDACHCTKAHGLRSTVPAHREIWAGQIL
jgi:hypothetical protein